MCIENLKSLLGLKTGAFIACQFLAEPMFGVELHIVGCLDGNKAD